MLAAILLTVVVIAYRVVLGTMGGGDLGWLHNFCPLAAVALCGAAFLPKRIALILPLSALLVSDIILNLHYGVAPLRGAMLPQYFGLLLIAGLGFLIRANPRLGYLLLASAAGSIFFYLLTNTGSWLENPQYAKSGAGWIQALTTGLPQYQPPTWVFFRNSLVSDLLFTAFFYACMVVQPSVRAARAQARSEPGVAAW